MTRKMETLTAVSTLLLLFGPLLPAPVLLVTAGAGLVLGLAWLRRGRGRA